MAETLTSPIKWHGGKHYLAPKLIALLPAHVHRVHPYAGGLSELFAWPYEGVSEVVNDLNGELTAFWRALQSEIMFSEFLREVQATPFSSAEFNGASAASKESQEFLDSDPVAVAINFFIRCRQSRQGLMKDFATLSRNRTRRGMNEQVSAWLTAVEGLPEVHERLKRVVIFNKPALEVIRQQDGPSTLFYCDPPYLHSTRETTNDYAHEMTTEAHISLLKVLSTIKGKFMLSGYPNTIYDSWAVNHEWHCVDFDLPNNASSKKLKERKIERVWMNFKPGA